MIRQRFEILLVEDNQADADLIAESLDEAKFLCNINVARDGTEAMAFLCRQGDYKYAPRPRLILLDLNMPRMDGREVLRRIKQDRRLKQIPVVVLTSSKAESDIVKSYDLHANAYITKPVGLDGLTEIVHAMDNFWFSIVTLPGGGH
jgi:CheY-like chemotaxis protein